MAPFACARCCLGEMISIGRLWTLAAVPSQFSLPTWRFCKRGVTNRRKSMTTLESITVCLFNEANKGLKLPAGYLSLIHEQRMRKNHFQGLFLRQGFQATVRGINHLREEKHDRFTGLS